MSLSDVQNKSTPSLPDPSITKSSVTTPGSVSLTNPVNNAKDGTPPTGRTFHEDIVSLLKAKLDPIYVL